MKIKILSILLMFLMLCFNGMAQEEFKPVNSVSKTNQGNKQELITLELKDIDIVEVLKILARKGNLNIIIGQNVKGRITLFLKDVTVWDALKNVFEIANLAYIKNGDVYQIITGRDYLQMYGREFFDNREMKIIPIQNASASFPMVFPVSVPFSASSRVQIISSIPR